MILNYPQKNSYELNGNESDAVFWGVWFLKFIAT